MDLIASFTFTDLVAGVSIAWFFGTITALFYSVYKSNPIVESIVNTTLVVLKNTEVVWKPVFNASLVVLRPLSDFALMVLRPLGPLALVVFETSLKALVLFGYVTAMVVFEMVHFAQQCMRWMNNATLTFKQGAVNMYEGSKELAFSLFTIVRALGSLSLNLMNGLSLLITSFENVGNFFYNVLFQTHTLTWQDVTDIALPCVVVFSILGYMAWRVTTKCRRPTALHKKVDSEDLVVPRRSARLLRKRAMLFANDISSALSPCEKSSSRTTNL